MTADEHREGAKVGRIVAADTEVVRRKIAAGHTEAVVHIGNTAVDQDTELVAVEGSLVEVTLVGQIHMAVVACSAAGRTVVDLGTMAAVAAAQAIVGVDNLAAATHLAVVVQMDLEGKVIQSMVVAADPN